jgi:hypothetical protein
VAPRDSFGAEGFCYSQRSAVMGSILVARRAGNAGDSCYQKEQNR